MRVLEEVPASELDLDYLEIRTTELEDRGPASAEPVEARILVAARVGTTRLIDNLPLTLGAGQLLMPGSARRSVACLVDDAARRPAGGPTPGGR